MKKKLIITFATLLFGALLIAGCGKSDEQRARDEIMSHMDADEKANIAADQQAIADYEAQKQAEAEAIANEEHIDYANLLEDRDVNSISFICGDNPSYSLNVLAPSDEYSYDGHNPNSGIYSYGQNKKDLYIVVDYCDMTTNGLELVGSYNNYNIFVNHLSSKNTAIVIDDGTSRLLNIGISTFDDDYLGDMNDIYEKNLNYIIEQLSSGEVVSDTEDSEALGDADPEIFGSYSGNGIDVTIGYGNDSFEITITGAETFNGPLSWLADDLYDCRVDETWLQVQLVDSNTITIRSSYLPLEGTYTRE